MREPFVAFGDFELFFCDWDEFVNKFADLSQTGIHWWCPMALKIESGRIQSNNMNFLSGRKCEVITLSLILWTQ